MARRSDEMNTERQLKPTSSDAETLRRQLTGRGRGIKDDRVIQAVTSVPRHLFVPKEYLTHSYDDGPVPIGYGQTISQPFVVAFMTELLQLRPNDRILEVGFGSGYQTAVLAKLARWVYGLEIVEALAAQAQSRLRELHIHNVTLRNGDGNDGWSDEAPFEAILVACAATRVPTSLLGQLSVGGRMIIPLGDRFTGQQLWLFEKDENGVRRSAVLPVRFVPMTGKTEMQ